MKNIFLKIIFLITTFLFTISNLSAYDQVFPSIKLRHGYQYDFSDTFINGNYKSFIQKVTTTFHEDGDMNGGKNPDFDYTNEIKSKGFLVGAKESALIVESSNPKYYQIIYHPVARKSNNIELIFDMKFSQAIDGKWVETESHTEYQPYEITWCGDGIRDNYTEFSGIHINETCDPGDTNHAGWGNGGCDAVTCEPINTPSCNSLTATPITGNSPFSTNVVCTGYQVSTYTINCGNGQVFNGTGTNTGIQNFTQTCNYASAGNFTPTCTINGNITGPQCTRSVLVNGVGPSISIVKSDFNSSDFDTIIGNDTQSVSVGSGAIFKIAVTNNGTEDLNTLVLTDAIAPNCAGSITLPSTIPSTWSNLTTYGIGNHTDNILQVGESFSYTCDKTNTLANYTNTAGVSARGVTSGTNVSANDNTQVIIGTNPLACQAGVSGTQSSTISATTPNLCSRAGESVINFTSSTSGNTTNYAWNCRNTTTNTTYTGGNCSASYSTGGGTTGGGGDIPRCSDIEENGTTIKCIGNSQVEQFRLDCPNGSTHKTRNYVRNTTTGLREASFDVSLCAFPAGSNHIGTTCYVTDSIDTVGTPSWRSSNQCILGDNTCGNGILEGNEKCEKLPNGNWPSFCTSSCQIRGISTTPDGETESIITIPNQGEIVFAPAANVIIGHGVSAFTKLYKPTIRNDSDYALQFDELCLKQTSGDSLDNNTTLCKTMPSILYPGQIVSFDITPTGFVGNKANITGDYEDNLLVTTIKDSGVIYDTAYFTAKSKVRVVKPSIATAGGGTAYVKQQEIAKKIADINKVALKKTEENKNFAGVGVSDKNVSSFTKTATGTTNKIVKNTEKTGTSVKTTTTKNTTTSSTTRTEFGKYKGMSNVLIASGDHNISSLPSLNGPATYIVENGNLTISGDIDSNGYNVAFVVKNGNFIINTSVREIDGTYIAIKGTNSDFGKINSNGRTSNQLKVNGSLYGDFTDLVYDRDYISESSNGNISVGTIVSFGSSLFKKPAPLISQFITEYLNSKKVAK